MARIRTIKPEFFTSLTVASLRIETRLTFVGLWTHVDDYGRCVDDARLVKAALWPLDDRVASDVEEDLAELAEAGLIVRYRAGRRTYLAVTGWAEHQKVSHPSKSRIPAPPDAPDGHPQDDPPESSGNPPESLRRPPEDSGGRQESPPPTNHENQPPPQLACANTYAHTTPEILRRTHEILPPDQGSGIREQGKDHHQRAHADARDVRLVTTLTGADDDEADFVIEKIMTRHRPTNPGGYIRTMHRQGDLAAVLAEVREDRQRATKATERRALLAAKMREEDEGAEQAPPVTPEQAKAARSALRAFLAGKGPAPSCEPAPVGALLRVVES
jgi:hypothetical protein